ncbi:MAG: hypothetical protein ACSLFK_05870 [Gemmatimonadaceae bacterium]
MRRFALPGCLWRRYPSATVAGSAGHLGNVGLDELQTLATQILAKIARIRADEDGPEAAREADPMVPTFVIAKRYCVSDNTVRKSWERHPEIGEKRRGKIFIDPDAYARLPKRSR